MDRRSFIKKSVATSVTVGSYLAFGRFNDLYAYPPTPFDLVAIKNGEPGVMFDKGIEALGGMKAFVA
jgi:hypothetical protein